MLRHVRLQGSAQEVEDLASHPGELEHTDRVPVLLLDVGMDGGQMLQHHLTGGRGAAVVVIGWAGPGREWPGRGEPAAA